MRIAYDEQIFGMQAIGGISRYITEIASGIALSGKSNVTVLAPIHVNRYLRDSSSSCSMQVIGQYLPKLPKTGRPIRFASSAIASLVFPSLRPNVIHQTYYGPIRRVGDARTVLTVHDMSHELLPQFSKAVATRNAKRAAIEGCDHIICVSENTRRDLIGLMNVDASKISVVHLGATLLKVDPDAVAWPSPYILFLGQRWGYKNFERFLIGYANSPQLRENFSIVCFGGGAISQQEHVEIARLGLSSDKVIHVTGDDSKLAAYYSKAAAFVYPSFYEGFGIPILEAMACGCPVACSNRSSFPEVAGSASEYFEPESSESIAEAIKSVVFAEERRSTLIAEGAQRVKLFTWDRCASSTERIYNSLA